MKNNSLVIMAGGASSRMKKSLEDVNLPDSIIQIAQKRHKSLIPLGKSGKPLLYYLFKNAVEAGIMNIYLITSPENVSFKDFLKDIGEESEFRNLSVKFAVQYVPEGRKKPLGTADALQQCLEQHPNLQEENFTVCNGDNLYSVGAIKALGSQRNALNALIKYDGKGLGHSREKIAKFALLDFTKDNLLLDILEKPNHSELGKYELRHKKLWVSMNIFNFHGSSIYPFLQQCPIHPERHEKELPVAVRNLVKENPEEVVCIPRSEKIPDLTSAQDIATFFA